MASTPKKSPAPAKTTKATVQTTVSDVSKEPIVSAQDEEKEALRKQVEEMKAQMAYMMGQISTQPEPSKPVKERNITFINLTTGTLILKGSQIWKLAGQFTQRSFLEREARIIVNHMRNAINSGLVYIADAQFVEDNDLGEIYQFLLNDDQLKTLMENKAEHILEMYKSASPAQQEIIVNMVINKKEKGEPVDGNVLMELGKLINKDLVSIESE